MMSLLVLYLRKSFLIVVFILLMLSIISLLWFFVRVFYVDGSSDYAMRGQILGFISFLSIAEFAVYKYLKNSKITNKDILETPIV